MTVTSRDLEGLINWTTDYFKSAGIEKAIVGISGGIDSAVVASLCVAALGKKNVIGVVLPCHSQMIDEDLAEKLINNLKIKCMIGQLDETFDTVWKEYKWQANYNVGDKFMPRTMNKLVSANAKARLRMTYLYMVAGHIGGLVVGTTNKTEAMLGYATKHGDHGVDIEPLQDFHKPEIYELAEMLNKVHKDTQNHDFDKIGPIPEEIIKRLPSAGLWEDQTDEAELGMSYNRIVNILKYLNQTKDMNELQADDMIPPSMLPADIYRIKDLVKAAKHKQNPNMPLYKRTS